MKTIILEEIELHIRLNEDDWCRNPQAQLERFIEESEYTRCSCGGEIKSTNITGDLECSICDKSY